MKAILKEVPRNKLYPVERLEKIFELERVRLIKMHYLAIQKLRANGIELIAGVTINHYAYPLRGEGKVNQWRTPEEFATIVFGIVTNDVAAVNNGKYEEKE